jgi:hypothetical protein
VTWDDAEVDALHRRLRVLAERSGLTLPTLDVVDGPKGRLLPATVRDGGDGEDHVAVASSLLRAGPDAQTWLLATALGHWASPVPRRRRRQGWAVLRRAGHDPVTLTRQVFAGEQDPSWWTRLHSRAPAPSTRFTAVQRWAGPDVAPPLY